MDEDFWPATSAAPSDEPPVVSVGVAHVPGLRSILEENTATELPLVQPRDLSQAE